MYVNPRFPSLVEAVLEKRRLEQMEAARKKERVHYVPFENQRKIKKVKVDKLPRIPAPIVTKSGEVYQPDPKVIAEIEADLYGPPPCDKPEGKVISLSFARHCPSCAKQVPYELHAANCQTLQKK